jgi:hypothetical protein
MRGGDVEGDSAYVDIFLEEFRMIADVMRSAGVGWDEGDERCAGGYGED